MNSMLNLEVRDWLICGGIAVAAAFTMESASIVFL